MSKKYLQQYLSIVLCFFCFLSLAQAKSTGDSLFRSIHDPIAGNPNGSISIVEFFDYQCSYCITIASSIRSIVKSNPNVRIIFKEYPILGETSNVASRAALAVNKISPQKYYIFH